jgi:hypothetical protein
MKDDEYKKFQERVKESGLTQQAFIINAVLQKSITSADEIKVIKDISSTFADFERQVRGIGTNVNQLAHIANGQGMISSENELKKTMATVENIRKESEPVWRSIRSLISQQRHTEQ